MVLTKISSWKMKFIIFGVLLFLMMGSTSPSHAVEYQFEEDFSDRELHNWTFDATDWTSGGDRDDIKETTHTWSYDDNELVSGGTEDINKMNGAFIRDNTNFGGWSLDVYVPATAKPHSQVNWRIWGILWSELRMGPPSIENSTHWSDFGVSFTQERIRVTGSNGTEGDLNPRTSLFPLFKADQYQHYDIIRTEDRFYVFVDNQMAINVSLHSTIGPAINFFTFNVVQGSNVKFDNIGITTDAEGLLAEMPEQTEPEAGPTTEGPGLLFLGASASVLALSTSVISWRQLKKKRIAKMVEISSNGQFPEVSQTISNIFDNKKSVYFLMLGYRSSKLDTLEENLELSLSSAMQNYRHLLHPFRLSIMQLLYTHTRMTSLQVKERLDLSWSDYYNSINALQKSGIIRAYEDFDDEGSKRQFLVMEENGKDDYEELISLVDRFVKMAKEFMPDSDTDDILYPHS